MMKYLLICLMFSAGYLHATELHPRFEQEVGQDWVQSCMEFGGGLGQMPVVRFCRNKNYEDGYFKTGETNYCSVTAVDTKRAYASDDEGANELFLQLNDQSHHFIMKRRHCSGRSNCLVSSLEIPCHRSSALNFVIHFAKHLQGGSKDNEGQGYRGTLPAFEASN